MGSVDTFILLSDLILGLIILCAYNATTREAPILFAVATTASKLVRQRTCGIIITFKMLQDYYILTK